MGSQGDDSSNDTYVRPSAAKVSLLKHAARKLSPRLRARVHWWIYDTPVLSEMFSARDGVMRIAHVSDRTRLVIDGFPRSGNSYARAAFMLANGIEIPISTHGHSHRFVERGVQRKIPVIALIRDPDDAIASLLQFEPSMTPGALARAYCRYYRGLQPLLDRIVVAEFDDVVRDFGHVIERCNNLFGSEFVAYRKTSDSEALVRAHIDAGTRNAVGVDAFDRVVPRPGFRNRDPLALLDLTGRDARAMDRARALYRQLLESNLH